jgi:hypothetical protein
MCNLHTEKIRTKPVVFWYYHQKASLNQSIHVHNDKSGLREAVVCVWIENSFMLLL